VNLRRFIYICAYIIHTYVHICSDAETNVKDFNVCLRLRKCVLSYTHKLKGESSKDIYVYVYYIYIICTYVCICSQVETNFKELEGKFKGAKQLHIHAAAEAEMYRCVCVHAKESEKFVGVFLSEFVRG